MSVRWSAPDAKNGRVSSTVSVARLVVVERLGPGLQANGVPRARGADGGRAALAVLVRAVEAVESVEPAGVGGERRLVGDDVDRARQRIRAVEQRAGAVDDLHAADRIGRDEPDLRAGAVGRLPRRVEPLAVHEHQQSRGVEAAQPRAHAEGSVADGRDVGGHRQRIAGRQRVGLLDGRPGNALHVQRNLAGLALGAGRGDADLGAQAADLELHGQIERWRRHRRSTRVRAASEKPSRVTMIRYVPGVGHVELKPPVVARLDRRFLAGRDAPQDDVCPGKQSAGRVGHRAADRCGVSRNGQKKPAEQQPRNPTCLTPSHLTPSWKRFPACFRRGPLR